MRNAPYFIVLNPYDVDTSVQQLRTEFSLEPDVVVALRRIVALFPRAAHLCFEESNVDLWRETSFDRFTFDTHTDELIVFDRSEETLIDACIEMVMYLTGFSTMLGCQDTWVIEFAIGAWKLIRKRIKRQLDIPVAEQPRGVVGLPPDREKAPPDDPYPFRTMVARYDRVSFQHMIMLAGKENTAVYFPPETHPKVLAVYVYVRRAMQDVVQGIDLKDYQRFNVRLLEEIQRLENLFNPAALPSLDWLQNPINPRIPQDQSGQLDSFPDHSPATPPEPSSRLSPFEDFIEQLFSDDDADGNPLNQH